MSTVDYTTAAIHLNAAKYFQLASFIMLVYDHVLTFSQEVERIWKRKFSGATILFFIVRYVNVLDAIVLVVAFHDPKWKNNFCSNYVMFEGLQTIILVAIGELIMILRVYALFARNRYLLTFLMILWAFQVSLSSSNIAHHSPIPLPPIFVGCILSLEGFPWIWVTPMITDSCIFFLTIWKTAGNVLSSKNSNCNSAFHILFRDGIMYFLAIFVANLLNVLIYFSAVEDLKVIGATFSQLITAVMVNRLVLNLRYTHPASAQVLVFQPTRTYTISSLLDKTIGNLGEAIEMSDSADVE